MTLDLNCVRDTLLTLEEWLVLDDNLDFHRLGLDDICRSSEMLKHSKSSIAYTLVLLDEADFNQMFDFLMKELVFITLQ